MYVYTHVYMYICLSLSLYTYVHVYIHICTYAYLSLQWHKDPQLVVTWRSGHDPLSVSAFELGPSGLIRCLVPAEPSVQAAPVELRGAKRAQCS